MNHPDPEHSKFQKEFLKRCDPEKRRFHELTFKVGNARITFLQSPEWVEMTEGQWKMWVNSLSDDSFRKALTEKGFEGCIDDPQFITFINKQNEIGFEEYIRKNLKRKDFEEYKTMMGL